MESYLKKATELAPNNPEYALSYSTRFVNKDPKRFKELVLDLLKRFPDSTQAISGLYILIIREKDQSKKIEYMELKRSMFPPSENSSTLTVMSDYYSLFLFSNSEKAIELSKELLGDIKDERMKKMWERNLKSAEQIHADQSLLSQYKPLGTIALIDSLKLPPVVGAELSILKAEAYSAASQSERAYQIMLDEYVKKPSDAAGEVLYRLAGLVGKDRKIAD